MVSRKRLLGRGIADRWVGLLRRHRVESKTAPDGSGRCFQHRYPGPVQGPTPHRTTGKGVYMRIPISSDASRIDRPFAPLMRGEAR